MIALPLLAAAAILSRVRLTGAITGQPFSAMPAAELTARYAEAAYFIYGTATAFAAVPVRSPPTGLDREAVRQRAYQVRMLVRRPDPTQKVQRHRRRRMAERDGTSKARRSSCRCRKNWCASATRGSAVVAQAAGVSSPRLGPGLGQGALRIAVHPGDAYSLRHLHAAADAVRHPKAINPGGG